jgi:hypothetical protein
MSKTLKLKELNRQYEFVYNEWVRKFANKQDIDFDGWVGNTVGGIAVFINQYFFNLSDIILDLNTKQPKGLILEWYNANTDFNIGNDKPIYINYNSYIKGLRHKDIAIYAVGSY